VDNGRRYFFDGDVPKFPFYWTSRPLKFNSWSYHSMNVEDRLVLEVLDHLSHKIPTRALLRLYTLKRRRKYFLGMYFFKFFFIAIDF